MDNVRLLDAERYLRQEALEAERDELFTLLRANAIDESVFQQLVREIDLMESSLARASH